MQGIRSCTSDGFALRASLRDQHCGSVLRIVYNCAFIEAVSVYLRVSRSGEYCRYDVTICGRG